MRPGFWRKCRVCFRWCRISALLLVLAAVCAFVWLNRVGLPDFLKTRLVAALHSRGIELEFSRMRLRVTRGFVADNVRIGDARNPGSPALSLAEIELRLDFRTLLLHRQFQIDGLVLREGELVWTVSPADVLTLDNIQTDLRFQTNDTWLLDNFRAEFAGAQLNLSGEIAHASEIRNWQIFQGQKSTNQPAQLQNILDMLAQIHFDGSPQLSLAVSGDARAIHSIIVRLAVAQARTQLALDGGADDAAENYHWHAGGALDPEFIRPFLTVAGDTRGLDLLKSAQPLFLNVDGRGRLDSFESIGVTGRVALTNFMVRGESFGDVESAFDYTNRALEFLNPLTHTGAQMMMADSLTLDFNTWRIYFTNGFSTADPEPVVRAIGPKTAEAVKPYHFVQPPTARVNGWLSVRDITDVDMKFDIIKGAPFEWLKFRMADVTGGIHWQGQYLFLTNVAAAFYGGRADGFADFDFRAPNEGADYDFGINLTNVNLHLLAADLSSPSNTLEGALSGQLVVTGADTQDWRTWNGFGHASLRDGLIWEIPLFGVLSPPLNKVWPGLGSSRATAAMAQFAITNGVISTGSLEIRSTLAQLQYVGNINLAGNVNMRATAMLLHNTPVIGSAVSFILTPFTKLFEYQVTGKLKEPKSELVYWPRFLMNPIRSFEEMFPAGAVTNAPAGN